MPAVLGLARQSVQRVADLLVEEGLAVYQENPADQRADLLKLTPRGRSVLASIQEAQRVWADDIGAKIGGRKLRAGVELLEEVMIALGEKPLR